MVPEQDGAPARAAKKTLEWLTEHMVGRVISKGVTISWPPRSPIDTSGFLSVGSHQADGLQGKAIDLTELKAVIRMTTGGVSQ